MMKTMKTKTKRSSNDNYGCRSDNYNEQHTTHPQPHEPLLVGWITGGMMEGRENNRNNARTTHHTTRPQPHEPLLMGWIAGWNDGRRKGVRTMAAMAAMHEHHSTCPQPHEHLLVGWISGGRTKNGREEEQWQQRANNTPPAPSLMSNCLWGGSWVE
jgi:hypothetical protein